MRAIITRSLYIFHPIFEGQKCFLRSLFSKILHLCMVSIQERVKLAWVWYTQNCHLKSKWSNVFGCQWFIPWLVDAIHQSSFQWSKSGLYCSQMTSIQMCMQTPPTSGFEPAKKSTLWSIIKNLIHICILSFQGTKTINSGSWLGLQCMVFLKVRKL